MANFYKSVLYDPTDTNLNTLYTAPSNARAIIQNIQIANEQGARTLSVQVTDTSASQTVQVAFESFSGVSCINIAKGPIIIEENDVLKAQVSDSADISGAISILEISREDQNG